MEELKIIRNRLNSDFPRLKAENDQYKITIMYDGDYAKDRENHSLKPERFVISVESKKTLAGLMISADGHMVIDLVSSTFPVTRAEKVIEEIKKLTDDSKELFTFVRQFTE